MNDHEKFWEDLKSGRFVSMVRESSKGRTLSNSAEVYNMIKPLCAEHPDVETVYGIFMDAKNRIIAVERLFSGSLSAASVYPREIVKMIIRIGAAGMVLVHNHPSGSCAPSVEDTLITLRIGIALVSIDVALHDHIIIGNGYHSMADSGWLQAARSRFMDFLTKTLSGKRG